MRQRLVFFASLLLVSALFVFLQLAQAQNKAQDDDVPQIYTTLTQVPDWLNTSRALTPDDLKGRVILVDFWTYCCINCIHVMPKLHALEQEFGDKLTVIGVHSAKFANESDTQNIREAIQKYDLRHPVVNDADFLIWNAFGINAWPTLLLIGPDGMMKQVYRGEGDLDAMRRDIRGLLNKYEGKVVTTALPIALERDKVPPTVLRFPTKLSTINDNTLVVGDSGHNRIVVVDLPSKKITHTIGKGIAGYKDGNLNEAQFDNPQGVLADGQQILVADTGNHRLRLIDLQAGKVSTLAGTGERGGSILLGSGRALRTALASPWDVDFYPDRNHIAIANAGTHQIWSYDREEKTLSIIAGNGQETINDGTLPFNALAQPSGLSAQNGKLYFADSETSALRVLDGKQVGTLIGTGLFDFGLKDGVQGTALLQHPIGIYADMDRVYVADTYNHKIRQYYNDSLSTLDIDGLKEPNDILKIGKQFYIADTNNHRIAMMDADGDGTGVLDILPMDKAVVFSNDLPNPIRLNVQNVAPEATVKLALPKDWHINPQAPSYLVLFDAQKKPVAQFSKDDLQDNTIALPVLQQGHDYTLQGILYYCPIADAGQCLIRGVQAELDVTAHEMEQSLVTIDLPM